MPSEATLRGGASTQSQLVAGLAQRLTGQGLQPGFVTAVHQFIGSAPTTPPARSATSNQVVRTVLSTPHLNYS